MNDPGRLRAEFARLVKENGKTAVFITHSISEPWRSATASCAETPRDDCLRCQLR